MLPGDSIVDKIFEEGLKEAVAVIVVLSKYSIEKPWVKEEINASFVKKVSGCCKLIPIVLDSVEVPECLKSTIWEEIKDVNSYEENFLRIINSIYGYRERPQLMSTPRYLDSSYISVPGLTKEDVIVLFEFCKKAINDGQNAFIEESDIMLLLERDSLNTVLVHESIDILERKGYLRGIKPIGGSLCQIRVTTKGISLYIEQNVSGFQEIYKQVCYSIINNDINNIEFSESSGIPIILVNHVFELLEQKSWLKITKTISGHYYILNISPELRRSLELM